MEWSDRGVLLSARPHGEGHAVVELFTEAHGRHAGLVYGGASRRMRPMLEPGAGVAATWRARLADNLGVFTLEVDAPRAARLLDDPLALAGLASLCAVARAVLAEREPHPGLFAATEIVLDALQDPDIWPALYVKWELGLLQEAGFGLELTRCVATGRREDLTHVSPKSGGAVSAEAAEPYRDKLLPLPAFLLGAQAGEASPHAVLQGVELTGYFLERRIFWPASREAPEPRKRLLERLSARARANVDDTSPPGESGV
ncbi:MAG: DNA repair protein RecO [Pseudomonadota bacterium]